MDQVEWFLESNDLKAYKEYFEEKGYDSMPQLLSMSSDELMSVCDATKLKKTGHRKRFIAATGILKSKKAQEGSVQSDEGIESPTHGNSIGLGDQDPTKCKYNGPGPPSGPHLPIWS